MKKFYPITIICCLLLASNLIYAQVPQYFKGPGTASSQFPFKNNGAAKTQLWYDPADFSPAIPSGTITTVYFRSQTGAQSGTYNNFNLLMKQPASGTGFTGTTFETGLTAVHSNATQNITTPAGAGDWFSITLTTPFPYNNSLPLVIEINYAPPFGGVGIDCFASSTTFNRKLYAASATATTGLASNGFWQDFGVDVVTICSSPPTAGNTTVSPDPACLGNSATLDLSGHTIGTGQDYQWETSPNIGGPYTNVGSVQTTSSLVINPTTPVYYRCKVTCSGLSDTSSALLVAVTNPVTTSVSIQTVETNICSGASTLFSATPTNGGSTPSYQWKINGNNVGTDNDTLITTAVTGPSDVTCEMASSIPCVTSNPAISNTINMTVITRLITSVTVDISTNDTICEEDEVTFTATPVNGGASPSYQWTKNGANVGTNSNTYTDNDIKDKNFFNCLMSTSETCVTSATIGTSPIIFSVSPPPPKPSITVSGNQVICSPASSYQWRFNGTDIPGATSQTHIAQQTGVYSVTISDATGCFVTSDDKSVKSTVGIAEATNDDGISVYPSPFNDLLTVELKREIAATYQLEIINASGQVVYRKQAASKKEVIDVSTLNSGLYLLNIRWDDQLISKQVLKK